jgi:hypothetical protein
LERQESGPKGHQNWRSSIEKEEKWENLRKLQESWEGPYIPKETDMPGAFRLMEQTGEELPYSWNTDSLKRYYP